MSIRQSFLAILDQGPCYGYQLRAEFEGRTGATWPLNIGQIYTTLDRLERDGLVERDDASSGEGEHIYYRITAKGHDEVAAWLGSPVPRTTAAPRDELAMKLAIAVTLPGVDIVALIQTQRAATFKVLQELTRSKNATGPATSADDLAWQLVVDSLLFQAEAEIRWLDHSETTLVRAAERGLGAALPLGEAPVRRARAARGAGPEARS
ncbi:PadR family transcriptional regulator [Frondihabitans australicus]|uniref:DNA-binding PadR family transcriptional regulator n=1 Tax=Frondihabitans australicus TaxID=386892 RepID=A0A495IGU1_9MICO|nr:PadR family transcriptional regulator [Frondihabitans australicus]RKR74531.1 DNA-binding PadR family transcriptional regulator [Frondihabitans australicus]